MTLTRRLRVRGRVQGVGFRQSLRAEARRLGCRGWVRNRSDLSVEAIVQGSEAAVEALIAWTRRGPPAARVDALEVSPAEGELQGFEIGATL